MPGQQGFSPQIQTGGQPSNLSSPSSPKKQAEQPNSPESPNKSPSSPEMYLSTVVNQENIGGVHYMYFIAEK